MIGFLKDLFLLFIVFFLIYYLFINKKKKDFNKLKESDEIKVFIKKNKINIKKINYKTLLLVLSAINAFIIAFTSTVILNIDNFIWAILVGFVVIMLLLYSLYSIAGKYFKKSEEKQNV